MRSGSGGTRASHPAFSVDMVRPVIEEYGGRLLSTFTREFRRFTPEPRRYDFQRLKARGDR